MDKVDNLTCKLEDEFFEVTKLNIEGDVNEILNDLKYGSKKFSNNLVFSASKVSDIIEYMENKVYEGKVNEDEDLRAEIRNGNSTTLRSNHDLLKSEVSEISQAWGRIQKLMERLSGEFGRFSNKLDSLSLDTGRHEQSGEDEDRVPLPTKVNGIRMSTDSLMKVLRYFPVPNGKDCKLEIKLRRRLILSHYEYNAAVEFIHQLQQLPTDQETEYLTHNSKLRIDNTKKILLSHLRDLLNFHESYREFSNEYRIALESATEPEHNSSEYIRTFEKMINKQRDLGQASPHSREANKLIRLSIFDLESSLKDLVRGIAKLAQNSE